MPLAALAVLLGVAITTDIRSRRIANKLVVSGIALAAVAHIASQLAGSPPLSGPQLWAPVAGLFVGGLAMLPLYLLRACGAGDVKLMAMVGAFIGAPTALLATLYTLIAGGLLSLLFMLGRGVARQVLANVRFILTDWMLRMRGGQGAQLPPLSNTAARLPYGVAIATGTAAALWQRLQPFA